MRLLLMAADRTLTPHRRALLARRIRWLVAATISYNVVVAVVAGGRIGDRHRCGQGGPGGLAW
ncbi:hypothetical protein [Mycobacterium sp. GA-2829]|uniref:hypothetical protein n=1 Tax=Mycobacterium sp. GA-2829 TaxID=1772283 RepID=UPI00073FD0A0|nr:hypothetical protein [Mycobacterium sp. GA-2829]KUI27910.1 hypothetical protein AU194_07775 [Mycobacterium sp. GA-2829]